jgi:hypothetical protein
MLPALLRQLSGSRPLISCGRNKKQTKDAASELYTSPRFRLSRSLADHLKLQYFVVSAKYGLLAPTEMIEPYDASLELFNDEQRIAWAKDILDRLLSVSKEIAHVVLLTADEYAEPLREVFNKKNISVMLPLDGLLSGRAPRRLPQSAAGGRARPPHAESPKFRLAKRGSARMQPAKSATCCHGCCHETIFGVLGRINK